MVDAIAISDLKKDYYNTKALKGISLTIKEGEFFALLGPNGAGKSTTISIMTGLCNKTSGAVHLFGKDIVSEYREARALVGLVPQEFNMDMFEQVYKMLYFNAGYFGIPTHKREARIKQVLTDLKLWDKRHARVRELSGGMKRKLMIARALLHEPKIIILDEPTAGVDVETRQTMWEYFRKLNKKGITILLTTHYIEEAEMLCDRVAIINHGKIIALDEKKNLMKLFEGETVHVELAKKVAGVPAALKKYGTTYDKKENVLVIPISAKKGDWKTVLAALTKAKLPIERIETKKRSLEEIFIHLTHNDKS